VLWLGQPIEEASSRTVAQFIDQLIGKRLHPKAINCYLDSVRSFYNYLINEEQVKIQNPVKRGYLLRLPRPMPRHLRDEEVPRLFSVIQNKRDRAMFMLMLRCGLRVEEVAKLTLRALDLPRSQLFVFQGKGNKDRVVYVSHDAKAALSDYLQSRPLSRASALFLVDKGRCRGRGISVRGIQKRMEQYARSSGLEVSCHQLRHTMATQLLNADAALVTIQDLLGHSRVRTTQRYCRVSNLKVQRDYQQAIGKVIQRHGL
jgi:site-specific recombinase XerD